MSDRVDIVEAIKLKILELNGTGDYVSDIGQNCFTSMRFWDELNDFPSVCVVAGTETRQYLPGDFQWGFLGVSIKLYVKTGDDPAVPLERLISDVELAIKKCTNMPYGISTKRTTDARVSSIVTDEGLLKPYGIGEVNISVQYQVS